MSMITEREWRRRVARAGRSHPRCWGAQYVISGGRPLYRDRALYTLMLLLSCLLALAMPILAADTPKAAEFPVAEAPVRSVLKVREVSDVGYHLPEGLDVRTATYTREQLLRGKLLLLDGAHPLPQGVPAPNTLSIASHGNGMVPVRDLAVKSGKETIAALQRLFAYARGRGVGSLSVWRGTLSRAEQHELRLAELRRGASAMSLDTAVARVLGGTDAPGQGELQQEYTVEIRLISSGGVPDERPLGTSEQGRFLLQHAWRFGFIRPRPDSEGALQYRFRYVGEAHSTAMTYLNLDMDSYLELLREKRVMTVRRDGKLRYIILCAPMGETHIEFALPVGASCEASLDNAGWAVAACTLGDE